MRLDCEAGPKLTDVAIPVETSPGEVTHLPDHRADLRHRSREYWIERYAEVKRAVEAIFDSDDVLLQLR